MRNLYVNEWRHLLNETITHWACRFQLVDLRYDPSNVGIRIDAHGQCRVSLIIEPAHLELVGGTPLHIRDAGHGSMSSLDEYRQMRVALEAVLNCADVLMGELRTVAVWYGDVPCPNCSGRGIETGTQRTCQVCNGTGIRKKPKQDSDSDPQPA